MVERKPVPLPKTYDQASTNMDVSILPILGPIWTDCEGTIWTEVGWPSIWVRFTRKGVVRNTDTCPIQSIALLRPVPNANGFPYMDMGWRKSCHMYRYLPSGPICAPISEMISMGLAEPISARSISYEKVYGF
jgi:hypothetical protein